MSKLTIKYFPEELSFQLSQENEVGLKFCEGYLSYLLNALKNEYDFPFRGGQFGVDRVNGCVILYDLSRGRKRKCIELSKNQVDNLIEAFSQKFSFILESYREETYE